MNRRKFTKEITKYISTGLVISTSQLITSCDDNGDVVPAEGSLILNIEEDAELIAGEVFSIKWASNGIDKIDLAYKIDQAVNYLTFQREFNASIGQFDFEVPDNINGSTLTFRITDSSSGEVLGDEISFNLIFKWLLKLSETQELDNVGGFVKVTEVNNPFIVRKTGVDNYLAISLICTHQSCVVGVETNGSFRCPCHGSTFTDMGEVTQGPAETALPTFRIEREGSDTLVIYYF